MTSSRKGPGRGEAVDRFEYFYLDIFRPRFAKVRGEQGELRYKDRWPRAWDVPSFAAEKAPEARRVFIIGGSVAQLYDIGQYRPRLEGALKELTGKTIEVVNCGRSGYDSFRDALALEEVLAFAPDLIVLMSAVNEGRPPPPVTLGRFCASAGGVPLLGRVCRRLITRRVRSAIPGYDLRQGFERNVRGMVRRARSVGVPMVLCTLPVNLRGMPPKGSLPLDDEAFLSAWGEWERGRWQRAADGFRAHLSSAPESAFGHYYLARSLDRLKRYPEAKEHYVAAWNAPRGTPVPELNGILRRVAREEGAVLADVERAFEAVSPRGIVGWTLFEDDVHWERFADPLVTLAVASALRERAREAEETVLVPADAWDDGWLRRNRASIRREASSPPASLAKRKSWIVFRHRMWDPSTAHDIVFSERMVALVGIIHRTNPELLADARLLKEWIREKLAGNIWDPRAPAKLDGWWPMLMAHVGEFYRRQGRSGPAFEYFREALRLAPGLGKVRQRLAELESAEPPRRESGPDRGGDPARGEQLTLEGELLLSGPREAIEAARKKGADDERALEILARAERVALGVGDRADMIRLYSELGRSERAVPAIGKILEEPSGALDARRWIYIASVAQEVGERSLALACLGRVRDLELDEKDLRRAAELYGGSGEHREAMTLLGELTERLPEDLNARLGHAHHAARAGEREAAVASLGRLDLSELDPGRLRRAAALYGELEEHRRAMEALGALVERSPGDPGLWMERAFHATRAGERKAAGEALARLEALEPDPGMLRRAAELHGELGDHARAAGLLAEVCERRPGDAGAWIDRADQAARLGERERAAEWLERARSLSVSPEQRRRMALLYQGWKEYPRAIEMLEELTRDKELAAVAYRDKGISEFLSGSTAAALGDLRAAIERDPGLLSAYMSMGFVLTSEGREDEALELYERALEATPRPEERGNRRLILESRRKLCKRSRGLAPRERAAGVFAGYCRLAVGKSDGGVSPRR